MALNLEKQLLFVSPEFHGYHGTTADPRSMELTTTIRYNSRALIDSDEGYFLTAGLGERRNPYHLCSHPAIYRHRSGKLFEPLSARPKVDN